MSAPKKNRFAAKYDQGEIEKICDQLLDWAETAKSIHLSNFCRKILKKSRKWLYETAEHYPLLKETIIEAKELISCKIVDASFYDKTVNAYAGLAYLPVYDSDYKDLLKWKAEISKEPPAKELNKEGFNEWLRRVRAGESVEI